VFNLPSLYDMLVLLPAIILGLTFHEFAHGWVAFQLGDNTAKRAGRLTLNPIAHIDPIGFIMLFIAHFGWAKPVPVNPYNFHVDPKKGMLYVSLAGPVTNFLLALISTFSLGIAQGLGLGGFKILIDILYYMIFINLVLAIFNLIPIPPLDGSKILAGILPGRQEWLIWLENYGIIFLLLLLFTGVIGGLMRIILLPFFNALVSFANALSILF